MRGRGSKSREVRRSNLSKSVNPHRAQILSLMSYEAQTEDISGAHVAPATRLATATVEHFKP